jgi:hypothetical protein
VVVSISTTAGITRAIISSIDPDIAATAGVVVRAGAVPAGPGAAAGCAACWLAAASHARAAAETAGAGAADAAGAAVGAAPGVVSGVISLGVLMSISRVSGSAGVRMKVQ